MLVSPGLRIQLSRTTGLRVHQINYCVNMGLRLVVVRDHQHLMVAQPEAIENMLHHADHVLLVRRLFWIGVLGALALLVMLVLSLGYLIAQLRIVSAGWGAWGDWAEWGLDFLSGAAVLFLVWITFPGMVGIVTGFESSGQFCRPRRPEQLN